MRKACSVFSKLLGVAAIVVGLHAGAQAMPPKVPRVGFCAGFGDPGHIFTKTFHEGLRKRGWEDGRNVQIVHPTGIWGSDFRPTQSCTDYMADKSLDVLVVLHHSDPNPRIPVVTLLWNIHGTALAKSTTRNITGIAREEDDWKVNAKRLALLKEAVGAERVMLLQPPAIPADPMVKPGLGSAEELPAELREAARRLGMSVVPMNITKREDLEPAFNAMAAKPRTAAILYDSPNWGGAGARTELFRQVLKHHRIPIMRSKADWVMANPPAPEMATIIAYGTSYLDEEDRFAYFVDRILRGARPADLPFEQTPNRLAINVDAARRIGITFPPSILTQADFMVPHHPTFDWTTTPQLKELVPKR
jgi:putative ABC transport system substrate-binding protein